MAFLFNLLIFLLPLTFAPVTSEIFEFNKMVLIYGFTIVISAAWAFECIKQKRIIFKHTPLTIPIIIFLISQIISTLFSIDQRTSVFGYYGRFNGGLLSSICYSLLYFSYVSFMDKEKTRKLLNTLIFSGGIVAVYAFLEHFGRSPSCLIITGDFNVNCFVQDIQTRVFGTFGQPNWLASYIVAVSPLTWAVMLSLPKHFSRMRAFRQSERFLGFLPAQAGAWNDKLYFSFSVLIFLVLLFTKSRSGLLGFGAAYIVFWGFTLKANLKKYLKNFSVLSLVFLVLLLLVNPLSPHASSNESAQTIPSDYKGGTESGEIRQIVWKGAIDLWMRYPLTGTGVETFAYSYYETRPPTHNNTSEWNYLYNKAHNEFLNFAATTGTIGLASYILLIISSLLIFFKNRKSIVNNALLAGYISLLVTNFFGFSTVTISTLFFLLPAMAFSLNTPKIKTKKTKNPDHIYILIVSIVMLSFQISLFKYWLADYFYAKGNFERAITLSPGEPIYRIEMAKKHAEAEELVKAEEQINFVKSVSPRNIKLLKEIAYIYGDLGYIDRDYFLKEQQQLQELSLLAPTDVQVKYQLALSFGKIGNIEKSKEVALEAINMKLDYKLARLYLANIFTAQGDTESAIKQYEYILKYISPDDEEIKNSLEKLK